MSNWNDIKKNITSVSPDEWDEIDLKAKIAGEIAETRKISMNTAVPVTHTADIRSVKER